MVGKIMHYIHSQYLLAQSALLLFLSSWDLLLCLKKVKEL